MIGQSDIMRNMFERISQIAKTDASVLIFGETGSGKELVAHAIHSQSLRKRADFVPVDCAAIPTDLLESELFGFEKGAFTGAVNRKYGLLEFAHKGTLFLDEILGLDSRLQVKLLRVLQEGCFRRIGGEQLINVDMRVVGAMNKTPEEAVSEGGLREDLYYRLNVIPIHVPPLRERRSDIPIMVSHFLKNTCTRNHLEAKEISLEAMDLLTNYQWPGNVRELENIMQRLALLISGSVINVKDLPTFIKSGKSDRSDLIFDKPFSEVKKKDLELLEKRYFSKILKYTNYNIAKAARLAGVSARTIYRVMDRYGKL
jgi:transcriptional regulator with PAS, ATPase and Fis domain